MSDESKSGPKEAVRGVVEGAKGLAKEAAGGVLGKEELEREGQAQHPTWLKLVRTVGTDLEERMVEVVG